MKIKIKPYNNADLLTPDQMDELMRIERECFKEELQEDENSKKFLIENAEIVLFAYDDHDGRIVGEAYCIIEKPEKADHPDDDVMEELFEEMDLNDSIYFMSFAVLPDYQGKGVAGQLLNDVLLQAKQLDFNYLYTHAKMGASAHLFGKYGEFISQHDNWFGTGESYLLFRIDLQGQ